MEYKEITDLLKLVNKTGLTEVVIEQNDFKIKIRRQQPESNVIYTQAQAPVAAAPVALPPAPAASAPAPAAQADAAPADTTPAASENTVIFRSPMIGTFYRSSSPDTPPFAKVGDEITKGQTVCIVEAMKLFNEIESEYEGKIVKIFVEDAQPVEYDQELFLIELN